MLRVSGSSPDNKIAVEIKNTNTKLSRLSSIHSTCPAFHCSFVVRTFYSELFFSLFFAFRLLPSLSRCHCYCTANKAPWLTHQILHFGTSRSLYFILARVISFHHKEREKKKLLLQDIEMPSSRYYQNRDQNKETNIYPYITA